MKWLRYTIVVMSHIKHQADKNDKLINDSCRFDLIEPFDRVKNAVTQLGKIDEKFR